MELIIVAVIGIFFACLSISSIVYWWKKFITGSNDDDISGVIFNTIGLIVVIVGFTVALVFLANAQEMEEITNRQKLENVGFNYLFKGEKGDEVCLYEDTDMNRDGGTAITNVFYCEEKP